jgi:hypothetical protein
MTISVWCEHTKKVKKRGEPDQGQRLSSVVTLLPLRLVKLSSKAYSPKERLKNLDTSLFFIVYKLDERYIQ